MGERRHSRAVALATVIALVIGSGCGRRESVEVPLPPEHDPRAIVDCLQARLPTLADAASDFWPPHAIERSADGRELAWRPLQARGEIGYALQVRLDEGHAHLRLEAMGPYGNDLDGTAAQLEAAQRIVEACITPIAKPSPDPHSP
ncbi:MAG: hypothetical protein ACRC2H_11800 [Silanimonas sp.]